MLSKRVTVSILMSTWVSNSYVRIPPDLQTDKLIMDVHAHLVEACELDPKLGETLRQARVQYQKGGDWVGLHEVSFGSLREPRIVETVRAITQKYVDEVVTLHCFGVVSSGAYGHFVEGTLVRFVAACEDWSESIGIAEPWETELIPQMGGLHEGTIVALGKRLQLPHVAEYSLPWDVDIPLIQ